MVKLFLKNELKFMTMTFYNNGEILKGVEAYEKFYYSICHQKRWSKGKI